MSKGSCLLVILPFALVLGAEKTTGAKTAAKDGKSTAQTQSAAPSKRPQPAPPALGGPAEEMAQPGRSYGKAMAVRTPFGVSKSDGSAAEPAEKPEAPIDMKVTEEGDSVRFERQGPFGPLKWVRRKAELTDVEKAAWERAQTAKAPQSEKGRE